MLRRKDRDNTILPTNLFLCTVESALLYVRYTEARSKGRMCVCALPLTAAHLRVVVFLWESSRDSPLFQNKEDRGDETECERRGGARTNP